MSDVLYERIIHYDENKEIQVRLSVKEFYDVEYLHIRKYYRDFEEVWQPSSDGISIPLDLNNSKELLIGLAEILSQAESVDVLDYFRTEITNLINERSSQSIN